MKTFKRFMKIFGICFACLIGFIGIVIAIYAIGGGFNPKPIEITKMSFLSSNGTSPADEISKISIIDDYVAKIYYEPDDATETTLDLTIVGDGVNIIELSSTKVSAGVEFTIRPKKKTVVIGGEEVQVNVGGEAQIVAKDQNNYVSCKLFVTVDVEVPAGGLDIIGMSGGEYREGLQGYRLYRVGDGLFELAIQTFPTNALEPNTNLYEDAKNIGSKTAILDYSEEAFTKVGDSKIETSYYSPSEKVYLSYDLYKTDVTKNGDGTYSLTKGGNTYSDLVITQHYICTFRISEDIANGNYNITAKVFKTYDIQEDFFAMQAGFANHKEPVGEEENKMVNAFLAKYRKYILASEGGAEFVQGHTNSVGDFQINNIKDYNDAISLLQITASTTFILENIDIEDMKTNETSVSFDLHSKTYKGADNTTYDLSEFSKEDLINMFNLYLNVKGTSTPVTKWVGDIVVLSLKDVTAATNFDEILSIVDGKLTIADGYDHSDTISVTSVNGKYSLSVLDELETNVKAVLLFATKYGDGENFSDQYKFCTINIDKIIVNLPESIKINTNLSTGGISTSMVTNSDMANQYKEQTFNDSTIQLGKGLENASAPLTYNKVMLFVSEENLFVKEGYPKIKLGSEKLTYVKGISDIVYTAYELPKDGNGNYYIRALNNSGENNISIFAAVVKTDIDGNISYKTVDENSEVYVLKATSADVSVKIDTYANESDIRWYVENGGTWYEKGVSNEASHDNELKMLLYETYNIYSTLYNLTEDGTIVIPTEEEGVDYLYNMEYAMADFYSNSNETSKFVSSGYLSITPPQQASVTLKVDNEETSVSMVKVSATTINSVDSNVAGKNRRMYLSNYPSKTVEFIISKIAITNISISIKNNSGTLVDITDPHPVRALVISKEFNGEWEWKIGDKTIDNSMFDYTYATDIDYVDENSFSDKLDVAFRTETNINTYKTNFAERFGTENVFTWSVDNSDIAEVTSDGHLTMKSGTFEGEEFTVTLSIVTYKNLGEEGKDTVTQNLYFVAREYPLDIITNVSTTGEVKDNGNTVSNETFRIVANDTTYRQSITANTVLKDIFTTTAGYFTDSDGNIVKQINIFDDIFRASGYSLASGDVVELVGNAKFAGVNGTGKMVTITENILTTKTLKIELDGTSEDTSITFNLTKKRVNVFSASTMKEGYLVEITSNNAVFEGGFKTVIVTKEMVEAKEIVAFLNGGASNTTISVNVYEPSKSLADADMKGEDKSFGFVKTLLNQGYSLIRISVTGAVFVYNNNGTQQELSEIYISSEDALSNYELKFKFESGNFKATVSYVATGDGIDDATGNIEHSNLVTSTTLSFEAKFAGVLEKTYSYKTDKLIDVQYNGVSLIYNEKGELKTHALNNSALTINGVQFTLSNKFTWNNDGSIAYSGTNASEPLEITIKIGDSEKVYYATFYKGE